MKRLKMIIPVLVVIMGMYLTGCSKNDTETSGKTENTEEKVAGGEVVTISLPTIQCNTCKQNIKNAFKEVDGVTDADVSVNDKTVKVTYDKSKVDVSKIESTITAAGYDANDKKADVNAYGKLDDCCKRPEDQKEKGMHM